jgi:cytidine diphosphoramidate kinase
LVIWITGLPGAGKTAIAKQLMTELKKESIQALMIDGDPIREVLQNFQYDVESRNYLANVYARMAKMFSEQGSVAICATVSMFDQVRRWNSINNAEYFEIYIQVSPEILQLRNQKNLYSDESKKNDTMLPGVSQHAELPKSPDLIIKNDGAADIYFIVDSILKSLKARFPKSMGRKMRSKARK